MCVSVVVFPGKGCLRPETPGVGLDEEWQLPPTRRWLWFFFQVLTALALRNPPTGVVPVDADRLRCPSCHLPLSVPGGTPAMSERRVFAAVARARSFSGDVHGPPGKGGHA